jgi:16S rRNA (uracil1498-N3)-methyltransferase
MATEIGVDEILFILSDYSKQHLKLFNYNKVVEVSISAASQCGLSIVPKIHQKPISIESLFLNNANLQPTSPCNIIVANESLSLGAKPSHLVNLVSDFKAKYKDVAILIGPEGGFSQEDNNVIRTNKLNVVEVSLGKNILRASTASTALLFLASIA